MFTGLDFHFTVDQCRMTVNRRPIINKCILQLLGFNAPMVHSKTGSIPSLRVACGVLSKETCWLVIVLPGMNTAGERLQSLPTWRFPLVRVP